MSAFADASIADRSTVLFEFPTPRPCDVNSATRRLPNGESTGCRDGLRPGPPKRGRLCVPGRSVRFREPGTTSSPFDRDCLGINLRHVAHEWWSPCHASAADPRSAARRSDQRVTQSVDLDAQYHQPRAPIVIATGHNPPRTKPRPVLWQWRGRCVRWQSLRPQRRGP